MALETLKDISVIDGEKVIRERGELSWDEFDEKRKEFPIHITDDKNMISFRIQDGPTKENGKNGCKATALIHAAKLIIEGLNRSHPCRENLLTITKLEQAILWQGYRAINKKERVVEGTNEI